jgi:hypothetical protein
LVAGSTGLAVLPGNNDPPATFLGVLGKVSSAGEDVQPLSDYPVGAALGEDALPPALQVDRVVADALQGGAELRRVPDDQLARTVRAPDAGRFRGLYF